MRVHRSAVCWHTRCFDTLALSREQVSGWAGVLRVECELGMCGAACACCRCQDRDVKCGTEVVGLTGWRATRVWEALHSRAAQPSGSLA